MEYKNIVKRLTNDGIIRKLDELGRIVIPKEIRDIIFSGEDIFFYEYLDYIVATNDNYSNKGIKRKIDELGRVVIPIEMRNRLGIKEKDKVTIWSYKKYIILKQTMDKCIFCKKDEELYKFKGKLICKKCKEEIEEG